MRCVAFVAEFTPLWACGSKAVTVPLKVELAAHSPDIAFSKHDTAAGTDLPIFLACSSQLRKIPTGLRSIQCVGKKTIVFNLDRAFQVQLTLVPTGVTTCNLGQNIHGVICSICDGVILTSLRVVKEIATYPL